MMVYNNNTYLVPKINVPMYDMSFLNLNDFSTRSPIREKKS